ncbi:hypothetical protein ILYODFUR_022341, partial [Ilyodon furcidens]
RRRQVHQALKGPSLLLLGLRLYLILQEYRQRGKHADSEANSCMEQTVMGVYVTSKEGAEPEDDPEGIGILIEGAEAPSGLGNIAQTCVVVFELNYCLNRSCPPELTCTFEVFQKILRNLDGQRLSSKAQFLKNKLMG